MMYNQAIPAASFPAYRAGSLQAPPGSLSVPMTTSMGSLQVSSGSFTLPTMTTTATTYAAPAASPYAAAAATMAQAFVSQAPQAATAYAAPQILSTPVMSPRAVVAPAPPMAAVAPAPPMAAVAAPPMILGSYSTSTSPTSYPVTTSSVPMAAAPAPSPAVYTSAPMPAGASAAQGQPWGGGCAWASDKTEFRRWVKAAFDFPTGKERKELYGFLCECFLDADTDRDGLVRPGEFDFLIEDAAALPRRFGMAPSWNECYGNENNRRQARSQMFNQMDTQRRGAIGMEEWIDFALKHIQEKVRTMKPEALDFKHLSQVSPDQFVQYCDIAVNNKHSEEYKSLYEHLFKVFVESDVEEKGTVRFENFDRLIEDAAAAPRKVGLAPMGSNAAFRRQEFQKMDADGSGTITFEEFLQWALVHIKGKVDGYKAGRGRPVMAGACPMPVAAALPMPAGVMYR